jgi:hypothetical protein
MPTLLFYLTRWLVQEYKNKVGYNSHLYLTFLLCHYMSKYFVK